MEFIKKVGEVIWNNKRLILIFVFSFLVYEFIAFPNNNGDPIAMYTFSHAIRIGEVPYRDFNIIATPLYAFLMSIGLFVFDDYLIFILEQCFLVTVLFYFLFKMYDKKAWIVLFCMSITSFFGFFPTYNFLCFLLIIILVYLEKNYSDKDYLVGFILGLSFLSKQTVGAFLVLTTIIIHFKSIKKLLKRATGFLIPCLILVVYLFFNDALYDFINLTFLGLFDFGSNNSNFQGIYFYFSIVVLIMMFYLMLKNRKAKFNYYLLCGFIFCIPLFDLNHFALFINCLAVFLVNYIDFGRRENFFSKLIIFINILFSILYFCCVNSLGGIFYRGINHFQYMYNFESDYYNDLKVNEFLAKYKDKKMIMLSGYTMFYAVTHDCQINYFDVMLYGNHGYNGAAKMIDKIKNENDVYIIVDMDKYDRNFEGSQYNVEVVKYVLDNYNIVDSRYNFDVYYKE